MKMRGPVILVYPSAYARSRLDYSVIYLLHGYSGNCAAWPKIVPLSNWADTFQVVFVCLDGNYNSWYLDSPVKKGSSYETFIITEAVPWVDRVIRTNASAQGRAIAGTSMGGHGALTLIARHPDLFIAAGSISGIMDLTQFPDEWEIDRLLGPLETNRDRWQKASFVSMVPLLAGKNRSMVLFAGLQDFALNGNRGAHQILQSYGISHEYHEYPGDHSWRFVQAHAREMIVFLASKLAPPKPEEGKKAVIGNR